MRPIQHPGPAAARRLDVVPARITRCAVTLAAGQPLLAAVAQALAPHGTRSAVLTLHGGRLWPLAFVLPALAKTTEHAVYFSDRFEADGPVTLGFAAVTFGQHNDRPWLHCHALWTAADGTRHCGHLLPDEAMLATPMAATAWLLDGAEFQVVTDVETRFSLFKPVACAAATPLPHPALAAARPALALRLAPNEDVCTALETACRAHGIRQATVCGGVGSTVGAVFDDGRVVQPFVTELLVQRGRVHTGADGAPVAEIDVSLVDHTGGLADGRLARGQNPVLVTFELVLVPD